MKAEDLVALAAAHGIDISHTVACETNTQGAARKRRMSKQERKDARGRPLLENVRGLATHVYRPRQWTHAETGMGAAGCGRLAWLAACYSWAGDRTGYEELHRGLTLAALDLAVRESWPWRVQLIDGRRDFYIERLTEMVLDAESCKAAFTEAPGLYAIYMGVTEPIWSKPLTACFLSAQGWYGRWLDIARGTIAQKLRA